jgi:hypothetical protein
MKKLYISFLILTLSFGCNSSQYVNSDVIGQWGLSNLVVSDSAWQVETEPVTLILEDNGTFQLNWYGGVTQKGKFNLRKSRLIIEDEESKPRYLEIQSASKDSLILNGSMDNEEVVMSFQRLD